LGEVFDDLPIAALSAFLRCPVRLARALLAVELRVSGSLGDFLLTVLGLSVGYRGLLWFTVACCLCMLITVWCCHRYFPMFR